MNASLVCYCLWTKPRKITKGAENCNPSWDNGQMHHLIDLFLAPWELQEQWYIVPLRSICRSPKSHETISWLDSAWVVSVWIHGVTRVRDGYQDFFSPLPFLQLPSRNLLPRWGERCNACTGFHDNSHEKAFIRLIEKLVPSRNWNCGPKRSWRKVWPKWLFLPKSLFESPLFRFEHLCVYSRVSEQFFLFFVGRAHDEVFASASWIVSYGVRAERHATYHICLLFLTWN